jgi:hypothetical protein
MPKNVKPPESFPKLEGSDSKALWNYSNDLRQSAENRANEIINWYIERKNPVARNARALRFMAIVFAAFGGLIPFIVGSGLLPKIVGLDWTQIGYISLGIAASCIALDRFFGFSSSWIRYITTSIVLQKHLAEFQYDWAVLSSKAVGNEFNPDMCENMLRRVQTFMLKILTELEKEAADWAAEYRSNLAEMEKATREKLETMGPGSISLRIVNADKIKDGVSILVDGVVKQVSKQQDIFLSPIDPGDHFIQAKGETNGSAITAAGNVRVETGRIVALELRLEVPKSL